MALFMQEGKRDEAKLRKDMLMGQGGLGAGEGKTGGWVDVVGRVAELKVQERRDNSSLPAVLETAACRTR